MVVVFKEFRVWLGNRAWEQPSTPPVTELVRAPGSHMRSSRTGESKCVLENDSAPSRQPVSMRAKEESGGARIPKDRSGTKGRERKKGTKSCLLSSQFCLESTLRVR